MSAREYYTQFVRSIDHINPNTTLFDFNQSDDLFKFNFYYNFTFSTPEEMVQRVDEIIHKILHKLNRIGIYITLNKYTTIKQLNYYANYYVNISRYLTNNLFDAIIAYYSIVVLLADN